PKFPLWGTGGLPVTCSLWTTWCSTSWLTTTTRFATTACFSLRFSFQSCSFLLILICKGCIICFLIFCSLALCQSFGNCSSDILCDDSDRFCCIIICWDRKVNFVWIAVSIYYSESANT